MTDILGALLDRTIVFVTRNWQLLVAITALVFVTRNHQGLRARRWIRGLLQVLRLPLPAACLIAALVSVAVNLIVFAGRGEPLPELHDDYSHLLLADTLRHGRLANPPHPFAPHFETMLALQHPKYASHFPPGNGAALAAGWIVFRLPMAGLWVAGALAAMAFVWAARAWLPVSWSLIGGVLMACHPTILEWGTTYVSGNLAFLGGALLLGAAARLLRRPTAGLSAVAAVAIVLLAHTRPFEGLVFTIAMGIAFLVAAPRAIPRLVRTSVPALCILAAGAASVLVYNRAVTGDPLLLPHALYDSRYVPASNFLWEAPRIAPAYPNAEIAGIFKTIYSSHDRLRREPGGQLRALDRKRSSMVEWLFPEPAKGSWVGSAAKLLYVPLLFLPRLFRQRRHNRLLFLILLLFLFAPLSIAWWISSHYLAPAVAVVGLLYLLALRQTFVSGRRFGGTVVLVLLAIAVWSSVEGVVSRLRHRQHRTEIQRRAIVAELERSPGKDLILVPEGVNGCVFNGAGIDGSPVVWARQLDARSNAALRDYFRDRRVWTLAIADGALRVRSESRVPPHPRPLP